MANMFSSRASSIAMAAAVAATLSMIQSIVPAAAANPSFSCSGNLEPAEAVICSDDGLAALDRTLSADYTRKLNGLPGNERSALIAAQRAWIGQRNNCRTDKACLQRAYQTRISQISGVGQTSSQLSCQDAVGAAQASVYVNQCTQVSTATHPPCNAGNACALIISEIRRGCALIGSNAPMFCAAYK
jgi:uncharacterized protein